MTTAFYANGTAIYDAIRTAGETHLFAIGMVAQSDAESSNNPKAIGDNGTARGLWQWHSDRVVVIKAGCKIDIHALPPIPQQVAAMLWEMHHVEHAAYAKINAATTPYEAGSIACTAYERAGAPGQADKRGKKAVQWNIYFQQKVGGA